MKKFVKGRMCSLRITDQEGSLTSLAKPQINHVEEDRYGACAVV